MSILHKPDPFSRRVPSGSKPTGRGWSAGQLLGMSGLSGATDYAEGLVGRVVGPGRLELCLPQTAVLACLDPVGPVEWGGDYLVAADPADRLSAVFVDAHHLLLRGRWRFDGPAEYTVDQQGDLMLVGVASRFDPDWLSADIQALIADRAGWIESLDLPAAMGRDARAALRKAVLMVRTQVMSAEGCIARRWSTPDRWPHRQMWLWDSVFHAIGWRHLDLGLACDVLTAVLDVQREDGFVPHMASPEEVSTITQPPILAFGVMQLLEAGADLEWARPLYPKLVAYLSWNQQNRDTDGGGLMEWFIEASENCRSGESGMDNSPRFDHALQLDAVDFNAFQAQEYRALAELAERLGHADEADGHRADWQRFCRLINERMWDDQTGFYHDVDPQTQQRAPILASSGFMPLFCGAASKTQAERLVAHLSNPETFGTELPIASVARCSRRGGEKDMWRGPVWINMNWLVAHALESYGYHAESQELRDRTCRALVDWHGRFETFFEFYDDEDRISPPRLDRKGRNAPDVSPYHQVIHDFGWSASLFIDWVFRSGSSAAD